jgi:hypothetical protein
MRRRIIAVMAAAVAAATAGGVLAGCGSSGTTQAAAQSAQPGGGTGMMSNTFNTALQSLVDDGTITVDQKTAVLKALSSAMSQGGPGAQGAAPGETRPSPGATPPGGGQQGQAPSGAQGGAPDMSSMFSSALDDLVSAGTITSAQQTAIVEVLSSAKPQGVPSGANNGAAPTPTATSAS